MNAEDMRAALENADRTIKAIWDVAELKCLPCQTPRFLGEKLNSMRERINELECERAGLLAQINALKEICLSQR